MGAGPPQTRARCFAMATQPPQPGGGEAFTSPARKGEAAGRTCAALAPGGTLRRLAGRSALLSAKPVQVVALGSLLTSSYGSRILYG